MWQVVIRVHGRLKWMGKYKTEAEALAVAAAEASLILLPDRSADDLADRL